MTQRASRRAGPLRCLLVDPSLFTGPYDAALDEGLRAAGVQTRWATRPVRPGQQRELPEGVADEFFYRWVDELPGWPSSLRALLKGCAHAWGLVLLMWRVLVSERPNVVHVQWAVLPLLDALALALIRCVRPVVFTVHDPVPYNGVRMSWAQQLGFHLPLKLAHRLVVHTASGARSLVAQGVAPDKIRVIPHGPLALKATPTPGRSKDPRWTFVIFGEIKPYKGIDTAIEALALLTPAQREQARVVVAGRARMDIEPLQRRAQALGVESILEWRVFRHSDQQMADLFADADSFLFPYRQIDASGVYFLVKSLRRWLIASEVGIFAQSVRAGVDGQLVPVGDVAALAGAMARSIEQRPVAEAMSNGEGWRSIGEATAEVYRQLLADEPAAVVQRPRA
jgi:glycosyltransferase involved in cell wall biosynthesis